MVQRVESKGLSEFVGIIEDVQLEEGIEERKQYHLTIKPIDIEVKGATGKFHEWVPMSPRAKEDSVPQGSVMDRYLSHVEICISAAKKAQTIGAALGMLKGKKFKFARLKLGKDFDGHPAKEYIVPVALVS
jgi:hypothetical protein